MCATTAKKKGEITSVKWLAKEDIRKAYFTAKLPKYLAELQAQKGITEEDLEELKNYLEELRAEDKNIVRALQLEVEGEEPLIPDEVLEEHLTDEQRVELEKEKKNCEMSRKLAEKMINTLAKRTLKGDTPTKDEVWNASIALIGLTFYIDRENVFRKRMFKKKIIEYVAKGIQRKEAEDYAMVSAEYRDYELNERLSLRIKEFIMVAKKMMEQQG